MDPESVPRDRCLHPRVDGGPGSDAAGFRVVPGRVQQGELRGVLQGPRAAIHLHLLPADHPLAPHHPRQVSHHDVIYTHVEHSL